MKMIVRRHPAGYFPWVVEDDSGEIGWFDSWGEAMEFAFEEAHYCEVSIVTPDLDEASLEVEAWVIEQGEPVRGQSADKPLQFGEFAAFGRVTASRGRAGVAPPRIRLGDEKFASVSEAKQAAVYLLSACAWVDREFELTET